MKKFCVAPVGMSTNQISRINGMATHTHTTNNMFARLGTDYEIRNQGFFVILEAMTTD